MYQISGAIYIEAGDFWAWVQNYIRASTECPDVPDVFFDKCNVHVVASPSQDLVLTECKADGEYRIPLEEFWSWVYDKYQPTKGDEYFYGVPEYHPDAHCMRIDFVASDGVGLPPSCHLRWQWRKLNEKEKGLRS